MILSVDWDFFVPEDPLLDLGHREDLLHLQALWYPRSMLMEVMKTSGQELDFWSKMREIVDLQATEINISESHVHAIRLVENSYEPLILVDAHHDCWPFSLRDGRAGCHNWVSALIKLGRRREVFWVVPSKDQRKACESKIQKEVRKNIKITSLDKLHRLVQDLGGVELVHACRSGCWTPPWLDKNWQAFVRSSGLEINLMEPEPWDGWVERWKENDLQAAIDLDKRFKIGHNKRINFQEEGK